MEDIFIIDTEDMDVDIMDIDVEVQVPQVQVVQNTKRNTNTRTSTSTKNTKESMDLKVGQAAQEAAVMEEEDTEIEEEHIIISTDMNILIECYMDMVMVTIIFQIITILDHLNDNFKIL